MKITPTKIAVVSVAALVLLCVAARFSDEGEAFTMLSRYIFPIEDPGVSNYKIRYDNLKTNILSGQGPNLTAGGALVLAPNGLLTNFTIFTDQYRTQAAFFSGTTFIFSNANGGIYMSGGSISASNMTISALGAANFYPTNTINLITAWAGPTGTFTFGPGRQQYTTAVDMALTNFAGAAPIGQESTGILSITNSGGSDRTLYATASNLTTEDGARSYVVTNHAQRKFYLNHDDMGYHLSTKPFR